MSSSNALKHDIIVSTSLYRGGLRLSLFCLPLVFIMVSFPSLLTLTFCLPLFFIALYIAFKEYQKTDLFRCSEIGEINLSEDDSKTALITQRSFYNGIFIFISLEYKVDFLNRKTNNPTRLILFRDSISEQDYRLIARLINHQ